MKDEILLISDLHVMSFWGLIHPDYVAKDIRVGKNQVQYEMNSPQEFSWRYWNKMINGCKNIDAVIINGDVIDGVNKKERWGSVQ